MSQSVEQPAAPVAPRVPTWLVDAGIILLCLAVVYAYAFTFKGIFPEIPTFWRMYHEDDFGAVLKSYLELEHEWYRPSAFHLYFWVLTRFMDWRQILGFRAVTVGLLFIVSLLVYALVRKRFPGERYAAVVAAVAYLTQPVVFILEYENTGFDWLYVIALLTLTLVYGGGAEREGRARRGAAVGSVVIFAFALTAKELAFVAPAFFLGLLALEVLLERRESTVGLGVLLRRRMTSLAVITGMAAVDVVYYFGHLRRLPSREGLYRTALDLRAVFANVARFGRWLVHLFTFRSDEYIDTNNTRLSLVVGVVVAIVLLGYWVTRFASRWRSALEEAGFFILWIGAFSAIPVVSGYAPWHITVPLVGSVTLFAVAGSRLFDAIERPLVQRVMRVGLLVLLVTAGAVNFKKQVHSPRYVLYAMNSSLVLSPPVPRERVPRGGLIYWDKGEFDNWSFGHGNLFRFAFDDPSLNLLGLTGDQLDDFDRAVLWLSTPDALFLRYDVRADRWRDDTESYRAHALRVVARRVWELSLAGRADELKPLLARFEARANHGADDPVRCLESLSAGKVSGCAAMGLVGFDEVAPSGEAAAWWFDGDPKGLGGTATVDLGTREPRRRELNDGELVLGGNPPTLYRLRQGSAPRVVPRKGSRVRVVNLGRELPSGEPMGVVLASDGAAWRPPSAEAVNAPAAELVSPTTTCIATLSASSKEGFACASESDERGMFWRLSTKQPMQWLVLTERVPAPVCDGRPLTAVAEVRVAKGKRVTMELFDCTTKPACDRTTTELTGDGGWRRLVLHTRLGVPSTRNYVSVGLFDAEAGDTIDVRSLRLEPGFGFAGAAPDSGG